MPTRKIITKVCYSSFEHQLQDAGALYYEDQDGSKRPASAGAYNSLFDYKKAEEVLNQYDDDQLIWLAAYYSDQSYLSFGFQVIRAGILFNLKGRKK